MKSFHAITNGVLFRRPMLYSTGNPTVALTKSSLYSPRAMTTQPRSTDLVTTITKDNGVSQLILNNPAKRNILSLEMLQLIIQNVQSLQATSRCIVISGRGPVFSSGHDVTQLATSPSSTHRDIFTLSNSLMLLVATSRVPVIASVDGLATAAGCRLVAACHMAICSERSQFATPGINIGLFCSTAGVQVGRAVNRKLALDMLITGERISASAALIGGLVSRVYPSSELLVEETDRISGLIAAHDSTVMGMGIDNFTQQMEMSVEEAGLHSVRTMVKNMEMVGEGVSG